MNRVATLTATSAVSLLAVLTCCCSSGDPPAEDREALEASDAAQPGPCGVGGREEARELFRGCSTDDDCVAVPVVGCCDNGWKTSVRRDLRDAYEHSFVCPTARPICPLYLVVDTRVPRCEPTTRLCEMDAHCAPASSH